MNNKDLYAVTWDDAHRDPGHYTVEDAIKEVHKPWRYIWIGILVKSDAIGITLAREVDENDEFRGLDFVPRALVREERLLGQLFPPLKRASRGKKKPEVSVSSASLETLS